MDCKTCTHNISYTNCSPGYIEKTHPTSQSKAADDWDLFKEETLKVT